MFIANSAAERNQYLDLVDWDSKKLCIVSRVYLLVEYGEQKEPLCFRWDKSGWKAFSCRLIRTGKADEYLIDYMRRAYAFDKESVKHADYLESVIRNGYSYEIKLNSKAVKLPKKVVFYEFMTDSECIDWFFDKYSDVLKRGNE